MPFNVLLLPLLGGYVFITYWNYTRFSSRRYSGERLLFHAALAGVVLLILSYAAVRLMELRWPASAATWRTWVYVGFIVRTFDPAYDRKYIVILPTMSGYRTETTHQVVFNTDYTRVYQVLMEEDESRLVRGVNDFQVVIPVAEVLSANLFDWEAYERFNELMPWRRHERLTAWNQRMPEARVELARGCPRRILSPLRLPFRHSGWAGNIVGPRCTRKPEPGSW